MHKIHSKVFEREDFSCDHMDESTLKVLDVIIEQLEALRGNFNETKDKVYWYSMIQLLPSSYNQMRTCTMTYENLRNMYHARKNHKLVDLFLLPCQILKCFLPHRLIRQIKQRGCLLLTVHPRLTAC